MPRVATIGAVGRQPSHQYGPLITISNDVLANLSYLIQVTSKKTSGIQT